METPVAKATSDLAWAAGGKSRPSSHIENYTDRGGIRHGRRRDLRPLDGLDGAVTIGASSWLAECLEAALDAPLNGPVPFLQQSDFSLDKSFGAGIKSPAIIRSYV